MSKKINPTAVGIFVVGALALLVAGLVVLGSGKLFEKRGQFVIYFKSSANGLEEGADVLLGGVKVGRVLRMQVQFDPITREKVIPVVIELSADRIAALTIDSKDTQDWLFSEESLNRAIAEGLRGRLMTKSVLTGQLFVDLDFFPDDEDSYRFPGEVVEGLPQIPSTKNEIERVLDSIAEGVQKLGGIDLVSLIEKLDRLITNLDAKVSELHLEGLGEKASGTLEKADSTLATIEELFADEKIRSAFANLNEATAELKDLIASIDKDNLNAVIADTRNAIAKAGTAMDEIKSAAANIAEITTPDAAISVRLNRTLATIGEASRSIQELADYLKRNPNSVLSGKKQP